MNIKEFEQLKEKLTAAKEAKNRLEGVKEQLFANLKSDTGFDTLEEAEDELEKIGTAKESLISERDSLYKELLSMANWDEL